ncbi:MAG: T9SS type A sorting domain-containing protein [Saprospiraceae bacterium]|nr:T9SS type A sorting domain-containing protein [Saprospiraceae bacterium]
MKKCAYLLLFALFAFGTNLSAQPYRYLDQVFTQASKTTAVYGSNFTVLTIGTPLAHTSRQPLAMDVYVPSGDVETSRPLIIYCHTGNFLPWINPSTMLSINGACGGLRTDSAAVEICTRLAKMGYVVASIDYRLGWRPDLADELQRRFTLINAAYRGVQDVRTCVRFFRKSVDTGGNPYGIDPNRITVFGQGTGGYLSLNTAALDKYSEILNTSEPGKFIISGIPMIIEAYNGDPYGIQATPGIVDATYGAITGYPVGDTLYVQNHPGYSSDFNLAVNMGGALGDKGWLDANTPPILSFHTPSDPYAPCGDGTVIVPGFNYAVVNVTGSCGVAPIQDGLGNNAVFAFGGLLNDALSVHARTLNNNSEAFYPLYRPATDSAPWEWNGFVPNTQLPNGMIVPLPCSTNAAAARTTTDTIMDYFAPRACRALGLDCPGVSVSTEDLIKNGAIVGIQPNPATSEINFMTQDNNLMLSVELIDVSGRTVRNVRNVNNNQLTVHRDGIAPGVYFAKIQFREGIITKKVILE